MHDCRLLDFGWRWWRWGRCWRCDLWLRRLLFNFWFDSRLDFRFSLDLDSRRLGFHRRGWLWWSLVYFDLRCFDGDDVVYDHNFPFCFGSIDPELLAQPFGETIFNRI